MWEQVWFVSEGDSNFVIGVCLHYALQRRRQINVSMKPGPAGNLPDFVWRSSSEWGKWTKTMTCPPLFLSALRSQGENIPYVTWRTVTDGPSWAQTALSLDSARAGCTPIINERWAERETHKEVSKSVSPRWVWGTVSIIAILMSACKEEGSALVSSE